jgi:glutamine amidotransferase
MIAIIDYGMGNLRSIFNTMNYIGEDAEVTCEPSKIEDATHIILPGVGSFGKAMSNLESRGLIEVLNRQVLEKGKPFLGICLGMQLLAKNSSEHGYNPGLGWLDAVIKKFTFKNNQLKLPHMGWNDIAVKRSHPFFSNLKEGEFTFYFVHSYHIVCNNPEYIAASCCYGYEFTAAVIESNIIATQFHPEKSQDNGIQLLENFVNWEL